MLPARHDGVALTRVVDVRHDGFADPAFVALCWAAGVSIVHTDSPDYPATGDASGAISYARLMNAREDVATGYAAPEIDGWVASARDWSAGRDVAVFPPAALDDMPPSRPRDTFLFYINGAKVRARQAAMATIARLG